MDTERLQQLREEAQNGYHGRVPVYGFDLLELLNRPATDAEILAQPCVVEALRKAREEGYRADRARIAGPWEVDTSAPSNGWVPGRRRFALAGFECAYTGTPHGESVWACAGVGETPGGETEADAWLIANGYTLLAKGS